MLPDPNDRMSPRGRQGFRALPMAVALSAIVVFGGLIGYTYMTKSGDSGDGPVPVIRAEQRPMKTRPDDPGGMEVPHQDKEVYDRLARESGAQMTAPKVERLLPPPEAPLPRPTNAPPPLESTIPAPPVVEPPPGAVEVPQRPAPPAQPPVVATPPAPSPTPGPAQQQAQAPRAAAPTPPPAAAAPAAPAPAARPGGYRVQLASLKTQDDANRALEQLRRTNSDLLGKLPLSVVRADLGARGTFYRVQAGPVGDEASARELCRRLGEKKVGCIVVRP
jgi:cell division septation protein DedD